MHYHVVKYAIIIILKILIIFIDFEKQHSIIF